MNEKLIQSEIVKLVDKYYADLQLIIDSSPYKSKWDCGEIMLILLQWTYNYNFQ